MAQQSDKNTFSAYISFNDVDRTFSLTDSAGVFSYDDIVTVQIVEERGPMGRGGIARAFSTSFLDTMSGVFVASEIKIKILMKDGREVVISLLKTPLKSNTLMYRTLKEKANTILAKLNEIQPQHEVEEQAADYMDELRKLKSLVEEGVITEQEYQLKKKKILGI